MSQLARRKTLRTSRIVRMLCIVANTFEELRKRAGLLPGSWTTPTPLHSSFFRLRPTLRGTAFGRSDTTQAMTPAPTSSNTGPAQRRTERLPKMSVKRTNACANVLALSACPPIRLNAPRPIVKLGAETAFSSDSDDTLARSPPITREK